MPRRLLRASSRSHRGGRRSRSRRLDRGGDRAPRHRALGVDVLRRRAAVRDAHACPSTTRSPTASRSTLAVARLRATQPDRRLGSLVFNFGGPGDAGTETLAGLRRADPGRGPRPLRPRELRPAGHRAARGRSNASTTPPPTASTRSTRRPNSDAELPSFYDGSHEPVDVVAPLRRPERRVARAARQPQRRPRRRPAARRARRRQARRTSDTPTAR